MKLSTALIGTMLLASATAQAQQKNPLKPVEKDTLKVTKRMTEARKPLLIHQLNAPDTLKPQKADTTGITPIKITKDYCPPCGMG